MKELGGRIFSNVVALSWVYTGPPPPPPLSSPPPPPPPSFLFLMKKPSLSHTEASWKAGLS
eukprot:1835957-Pyramimonas_sp.AAC.1